MEQKYLVIVAEGNAAMRPYWSTIVSDYLEKIVRNFCGSKSRGQEQSGAIIVQLGLVMFYSHGPLSDGLVRASGWTSDMNRFLEWLSASTFCGGGYNEAAIAEGLTEALVMFPKHPEGSQNHQSIIGQRHCILVSASNPFPLSRLVHLPKFEQGELSSVEFEYRMANAETVASSFTKCSVSLSVISPRQLPQLRAIFKAGNPSTANKPINNVKNPHHLVLLSEEFV